jgi:hypothetical protein
LEKGTIELREWVQTTPQHATRTKASVWS